LCLPTKDISLRLAAVFIIALSWGKAMNTKLEQAVARAVKKVPGNRGAAKVLLMDALQRELALEDEALMTSVAVVVDQVVEEGAHLDNLEGLMAEVIRRARRAHLRVIK
jgi:hypothetical protein